MPQETHMPTSTTPPLRVIHSITELVVGQDGGCIAVSGSHGGLSAAGYALAARPLLSVFNDAGVGKDGAGIVGLELLQSHGLAACAVGHDTARIGDAQSTLNDGVVRHANALAGALGIAPGMHCSQLVERLTSGWHR
jgi:hypothetical protein